MMCTLQRVGNRNRMAGTSISDLSACRAILHQLKEDIKPCNIMTRAAFGTLLT